MRDERADTAVVEGRAHSSVVTMTLFAGPRLAFTPGDFLCALVDRPFEQRPHDPSPLPVNIPRDESPSSGSWTWNDAASWTLTWWWSFGESIEQTAASTVTRPSFRRLAGDPRGRDVVAGRGRVAPARVDVHGVEDDLAAARELDLRQDGRAVAQHGERELDSDGLAHVDEVGGLAVSHA